MVTVKIFDGVSEHFLTVDRDVSINLPGSFDESEDLAAGWIRNVFGMLLRWLSDYWFKHLSGVVWSGFLFIQCEKYAVVMQNTPASLVYIIFFCVWFSDLKLALQVFGVNHPCCFLVLLLVIFFLVVWPEPLVRVASWDCGQKCLVKFDELLSVGTM